MNWKSDWAHGRPFIAKAMADRPALDPVTARILEKVYSFGFFVFFFIALLSFLSTHGHQRSALPSWTVLANPAGVSLPLSSARLDLLLLLLFLFLGFFSALGNGSSLGLRQSRCPPRYRRRPWRGGRGAQAIRVLPAASLHARLHARAAGAVCGPCERAYAPRAGPRLMTKWRGGVRARRSAARSRAACCSACTAHAL